MKQTTENIPYSKETHNSNKTFNHHGFYVEKNYWHETYKAELFFHKDKFYGERLEYWLPENKIYKTKEEAFSDIIYGLEINKFDGRPDSVFYMKNGSIYFEFETKNRYLYSSHWRVWSIFSEQFGMEHGDVKSFIKDQMFETLNLKDVTPQSTSRRIWRYGI